MRTSVATWGHRTYLAVFDLPMGPSGVNRATLHDVVRRRSHRGQSHDVLAVFGHVQKLAAILVHVGYLKIIFVQ